MMKRLWRFNDSRNTGSGVSSSCDAFLRKSFFSMETEENSRAREKFSDSSRRSFRRNLFRKCPFECQVYLTVLVCCDFNLCSLLRPRLLSFNNERQNLSSIRPSKATDRPPTTHAQVHHVVVFCVSETNTASSLLARHACSQKTTRNTNTAFSSPIPLLLAEHVQHAFYESFDFLPTLTFKVARATSGPMPL